jgi:flavin reductase (DIM6/NTAB) family NADH-FMN oxidoreductase RutF
MATEMDCGEAFHALVGGIDYPMFIVTTEAEDERSGCLVGFVTQGSIDPARMVVMLSKKNHTYRVATRATELVVHFLHDGNKALTELFGEETGDQIDKFSRCPWSRVDGVGAPVLDGTRGFAAGAILDRMDAGDHVAHLVEVRAARLDAEGPQLAFSMVKDIHPGHEA